MGIFSKDIASMDDLFVHTLCDVFYAEKQILKALPDVIDRATNDDLRESLQNHLGETRGQVERLEEVFRMHGAEPKEVDCPAIDGLLKEARELVSEVAEAGVLDAAIIAAVQAVENYEITRYGKLIVWANELGRSDCAAVLEASLAEEKAVDVKLSEIAQDRASRVAAP